MSLTSVPPPLHPPIQRRSARRARVLWRWLCRGLSLFSGVAMLWIGANVLEMTTGRRVLPWDSYQPCAEPSSLPETVRVGLYEEFPNPWRLARLKMVDFPVVLAIAAPSRAEFARLRAEILQEYPQVQEVYYWPLLSADEGYYPGTWSDARALQRVADDTGDLPVLWDLELPPNLANPSPKSWGSNRAFLDSWLRQRTEPVHIWRSYASMGLDPLFLKLIGLHYDPADYPAVSLHLDLYTTGDGLAPEKMWRVLRCGVERYGARFIPALGVLDDGEGTAQRFVPPATLRRDLQLVRDAGVAEVWLFGVNGLNEEYLQAIRETLPLAPLQPTQQLATDDAPPAEHEE